MSRGLCREPAAAEGRIMPISVKMFSAIMAMAGFAVFVTFGLACFFNWTWPPLPSAFLPSALLGHRRRRRSFDIDKLYDEEMKRYHGGITWGRTQIEQKSLILLGKWMTEQQRKCCRDLGWFLVVGKHTGHVYCVCLGSAHVVRVTGKRFAFGIYLMDHPIGDMALAQKLIVETNEKFMLRRACRVEVL